MRRLLMGVEVLEDRTLPSVSLGFEAPRLEPIAAATADVGTAAHQDIGAAAAWARAAPERSSAASAVPVDAEIHALLPEVRQRNEVPGMVAGVLVDGQLAGGAADGLRESGKLAAVTLDDRFHLGSLSKAMTATLAGILVERRQIRWSTTVGQAFPEFRRRIDPAYRDVTLHHLLTHRSGLPDLPGEQLSTLIAARNFPPFVARRVFLVPMLREPPAAAGGTYNYSNMGYVVAAAMLERVTGRSYENLMERLVFKPLGLKSAGFGPPGRGGAWPTQPCGHEADGTPVGFGRSADLPAVANPAGRIHMNLADWATFVQAHLGQAVNGRQLLRPETLEQLHTPYPGEGEQYAMGWGLLQTGNGLVLVHEGSNEHWYASMLVVPDEGLGILVAANRGGSPGQNAVGEMVGLLLQRLVAPRAEPA